MEHEGYRDPITESEYLRAEYNRVNELAITRLKEANQLFHWGVKIQRRYEVALVEERRRQTEEIQQTPALITALSS